MIRACILCLFSTALAEPVYLSERGQCPDPETLRSAMQRQLTRHETSSQPSPDAIAVAVIDLGARYRVSVNGITREFSDPERDCLERANTATVFVALTLEPPDLFTTPEPSPQPSPAPVTPPALVPRSPEIRAVTRPVRPGRFEMRALVGTGIGLVAAGTPADVAWQYDSLNMRYSRASVGASGVASAPIHIVVGMAARVTKLLSVGLAARFGQPLVNNADSTGSAVLGGPSGKSSSDASVMSELRLHFGEGRVHPFLGAGLGAGYIEHLLDLGGAQSNDHPLVDATTAARYPTGAPMGAPINRVCPLDSCIDTVHMGYFLASISAGTYFDLTRGPIIGDLRFIMEVEMQAAALPSYGLNFDFRFGIETAKF